MCAASEEVEAHPDEQRGLLFPGDHEPVCLALCPCHEQAAVQLAGEEEVPPEVEVDARGAAAGGTQLWIRIDRGDTHAHREEGPEEETVEEVVLEGELADP